MSNLLQIVNYDDLLHFLREGKNKIIVLALVLVDTEDDIKHMLRKFIKEKSREFPYILFLYYAMQSKDLGRAPSTILEKDRTQYPKLCHIYDVDQLLGDVTSIDNRKELDKSFAKLKPKYEQWVTMQQKSQSNEPEQNTEKSQIQQSQLRDQPQSQPQSQPQNQPQNQPQSEVIDPIKEKKKFMEKLLLLKSKGDDYKIEFIKDIQKRKKEEQKNKLKVNPK